MPGRLNVTEAYHKGLSIFFSNVDKPPLTEEKCLVCLAPMKVERRETYRSFVSAMADNKVDSWVYSCPKVGTKGHPELTALYKEWENLKSEKLKAIVWEEIEEKRKKLAP